MRCGAINRPAAKTSTNYHQSVSPPNSNQDEGEGVVATPPADFPLDIVPSLLNPDDFREFNPTLSLSELGPCALEFSLP